MKISEATQKRILQLKEDGLNGAQIFDRVQGEGHKVGITSVRKIINTGGVVVPASPAPEAPSNKIEKTFSEDTAFIHTNSTKWKTLEDALEAAEVDTDIWEVDKFTINAWDVTMKGPDGDPITATNYQIKIKLQRISADSKMDAIKATVDKLLSSPIKLPKPPKKKAGGVALEICLFDNHFGMLAWDEETGENYDLKIADKYYVNAVYDILARTDHLKVDKIIFPIGQDFFHMNSTSMTTPNGNNKLDVDGRYGKILTAGKMAVVKAVEACRMVAPVEIMWVPGNHDPETSYALICILDAYYRSAKNVTIDSSSSPRKCITYGDCAIGLTHGCYEKKKDTVSIFNANFPEFLNAKHKEIHEGHLHKEQETEIILTDTRQNVKKRIIPSLCGTDAWHHRQGYVGKNKAAQAFVWHKTDGLLNTYYTYA